MFWAFAASAAIGYLMGCFNPAYLLGKYKGHNVKREGSGNAGASNAAVLFGFKWGVVVALLDIGKAFLAMRLAGFLFPSVSYAPIAAGVCCVMGHLYPVTMRFRGGKGLAALGGMMLAYDWRLFLALFALGVVLLLIVQYIAVITVETVAAFPLSLLLVYHDTLAALLIAVCVPFIVCKHIENFRRIQNGTELRISWLWDKKAGGQP